MKISFTYTIDLGPHHIRMLKILAKGREGWSDNVIGRTLDDLAGWGLAEQSRLGAELYSITAKGHEALKKVEYASQLLLKKIENHEG